MPDLFAQIPADAPDDYYVNIVGMATSMADVTVLMAHMVPPPVGGDCTPTSPVRLVMALPVAKVLAEMLTARVAGWEAKYGPVPTPGAIEGDQPEDDEAAAAE